MKRFAAAISVLLALAFGQALSANAAEIKIFGVRALKTVLDRVGPEFERATGHRIDYVVDVGVRLLRRVDAGEPFDLFIGPPAQLDLLIRQGKIIPATRINLVRAGIGVEVRAGAPKPDIGSVDAFKRALLDAKSIAYLKEGASGVYLADALENLGIADAIRSKVTRPETDIVSEMVAKGEIELGMVVTTQILTTPGVELVGPLPAEIQYFVTFGGGVSASARDPEGARTLIRFLTGPRALAVIKEQGMEPAFPSGADAIRREQ